MAWPPGYPNTVVTPSASKLATTASAPSMMAPCFAVRLPRPRQAPSLAALRRAAFISSLFSLI